MKESKLTFTHGYCCAVADILRHLDNRALARKVLLSFGKVKRKDVSTEDWDVLVKYGLVTTTPRKQQ